MNPDQPKPASGEWTVSPIGEILHNGECMATAFTYVQGKACVDDINAAIAAAWRKGHADAQAPALERIDELHKQLDAELEKVDWLKSQLKLSNDALSPAQQEIHQLRTQLLETQAAISNYAEAFSKVGQ